MVCTKSFIAILSVFGAFYNVSVEAWMSMSISDAVGRKPESISIDGLF